MSHPSETPAARTPRIDHLLIADMVAPGARVLDVGCGDGDLLELLAERRQVDGRGIEKGRAEVSECVARGLSVIHGDADVDLEFYPDKSFDYAILSLTIQATILRSVTVAPATFLLAVGAKQQMTATLRDAAGAIITGRTVAWSSSNPAVAAVDAATGLVTAASTGVASIFATVDGITGAAFAYTGTTSPYDGTWRGSAGSGRTIAFTVSLGRIASLALNVGTPLGSPCALTYTASPLTLIASNAFTFTTSGGSASGTVSGSFLSSASAQGSYGTITFDDYLCPPNLLVKGTVPGATWTASKQ